MKKKTVFVFLLVSLFVIAAVFALAKTPPLSIKDPSPAKLTPSYAVFSAHAKDAGKKWKALLRARGFREFVNSPGGQALRKNYVLPVVDSFFPKKSAKHISGHFLKLLTRDVLISQFEADEGGEWIIAAKLNTRQKIGFRFMRRYLTRRNKLSSFAHENIPAYEIALSTKQKIYHAVAGNYVIFATQRILLEQSLSLAAGKGSDSLYARKDLCLKGFDSCFESKNGNAASPLLTLLFLPPFGQEKQSHEIIHVSDSAEGGTLRTTMKFFGTTQRAKGNSAPDMENISLLLPKDAVFLANINFSAPLRRGESLQAFLEKAETRKFAKDFLSLDVLKELLPHLEGNAILASTKIQTLSDETPLPDFMLLLPVKKTGKLQETKRAALSAADKVFSQGMKTTYKKKESTVYGTRVVSYARDRKGGGDVLSPSYAAIDNILAVSLSQHGMEKLLAVKKGYLPCLRDAEHYAKIQLPQSAKLYFYADGEKLPDYLSDYLTKLIPVSSGFLEKEIKEGFIPFVKELNRFSSVTASLYTQENSAEGTIEFAFKKQE